MNLIFLKLNQLKQDFEISQKYITIAGLKLENSQYVACACFRVDKTFRPIYKNLKVFILNFHFNFRFRVLLMCF